MRQVCIAPVVAVVGVLVAVPCRRPGSHPGAFAGVGGPEGTLPVAGPCPQRRHVVSSTLSRWEYRCARTVIVGMLSMRCAVMWRCWLLSNQSRGSPLPDVYVAPHRAS